MSNLKFAGFWLRFVAYLIDLIIVQVVQSILIIPILALIGLNLAFGEGFEDLKVMDEADFFVVAEGVFSTVTTFILLTSSVQLLYYSIMEASKFQGTFGKIALGLQVTNLDGSPIDFPTALLRNFAKIISSALFLLGYIIAGITEKKQALHDLIASAVVIRK
jgi:uncharacterized RDD family membrane protein YckC